MLLCNFKPIILAIWTASDHPNQRNAKPWHCFIAHMSIEWDGAAHQFSTATIKRFNELHFQPVELRPGVSILHYKLATFSRRQKPMCLLGENFQYRLLGEKGCNFIMILSSGEPQPIFSNVAFGPSALRQHWKILASAHHLIMLQYSVN